MQDAWRAYLELALGLTEAPRKKAQTVARKLVGSGGATAAQLQALAEEMVSTGMANREALTKIVRFEVDRALGAVGLATADEVADLTERVRHLERELREAKAAVPAPAAAQVRPVAKKTVARTVAQKTVANKTVAKKAVAERPTVGKRVDVRKLPTPVAKKAVARKAVAKKAAEQRRTTGEGDAG